MDPKKTHTNAYLLHNYLNNPTLTRPGFHLGAPKNIQWWQQIFYVTDIGKPSSRKLHWVMYYTLYGMHPQKNALKRTCLNNNLQNPTLTRPGFHLGAPKKHKVMTNSFLYKIYRNPLPEGCVGLFITLCTEWITNEPGVGGDLRQTPSWGMVHTRATQGQWIRLVMRTDCICKIFLYGDPSCLFLPASDGHWRPLMSIGHWPHFQQKICNSWHEPIGVRGFWRLVGRFFKILGRRKRTKEGGKCKMLLISRYFPVISSYVAHAGPLFSVIL